MTGGVVSAVEVCKKWVKMSEPVSFRVVPTGPAAHMSREVKGTHMSLPPSRSTLSVVRGPAISVLCVWKYR